MSSFTAAVGAAKRHLKVFGLAVVFGLSVYALLILFDIAVALVKSWF